MENISKKALTKIKKISINLNQEFVDFADKIAELTNQKKTTILTALIGKGAKPLIKDMETTWKSLLIAGNLEKNKKEKISKLLKGLDKIKKEEKEILGD